MVEIETLPDGRYKIQGPIKIVEKGEVTKELADAMMKKGLITLPLELGENKEEE